MRHTLTKSARGILFIYIVLGVFLSLGGCERLERGWAFLAQGPVKGKINGKRFRPTEVRFEDESLWLVSKKANAPQIEVRLTLPLKKGLVPEHKEYKVSESGSSEGPSPYVTIRELDSSESHIEQKVYFKDFALQLSFEKSIGETLSGQLLLKLPDFEASYLAGTFKADLRGFHLKGGSVDLAGDSLATLESVSRTYFSNAYHSTTLVVDGVRDQILTYAAEAGQPPTGYLEMTFRPEEKSVAITKRVQLIKDKIGKEGTAEWRVFAVLDETAIIEAHPLAPPPANDFYAKARLLCAQTLEARLQKSVPPQSVHQLKIVIKPLDGNSKAKCEVTYVDGASKQPRQWNTELRL